MLHWQTRHNPCLPLLIVTCVYKRRPAGREMSMYPTCVSLVNYNTSYVCQYLYAVHIASLLCRRRSVGAKKPSGLILNCADGQKVIKRYTLKTLDAKLAIRCCCIHRVGKVTFKNVFKNGRFFHLF